jgi:hypothetical protein
MRLRNMELSADRSSSRHDKGELVGSDDKLCHIAVRIASLLSMRPALFESAMLEVGDLQWFGACGQSRMNKAMSFGAYARGITHPWHRCSRLSWHWFEFMSSTCRARI